MPADDNYQQSRDVWDDYNNRQAFEHTLIDRKTTWLLTAQTILFAAYGVGLTSEVATHEPKVFRIVVGAAGAVVAALSWYAVGRLVDSKETSWKEYRDLFAKSRTLKLPEPFQDKELQWGVRTENTQKSLFPDKHLPVVFIIAWTILVISELLA